ncbi:MAG TPA: STAS domain-containing protein [Frankiaceae bacterium]|nr:STAS domain-containing protein [Frankiaceae bacterium]
MTQMLAAPPSCTGHRTLTPSGELDLATAPQLRQELVDASAAGSSLVVLDLEQVAFLDSVALSVIIGGHRRLQHHGARLHLAAPQTIVKRVLGMTRIDSVIPTYETVAAAEAGCPTDH